MLDLLNGGAAAWLSPVARSQVRALLRGLDQPDPDQWRGLLRARSDVRHVRVHPAALARLDTDRSVLPAGVGPAAQAGIDLLAIDPPPEVYIQEQHWNRLAKALHAQVVPAGGNLIVRIPQGVWPFQDRDAVGASALAADLLESAEPRAVEAGRRLLLDRLKVLR
jgi:hypothetical protein